MTLVYDTLLWRDEDGVPRPWLARSVRASADGRRLTVRLAKGARWHDGAPLTAADVAFTFAYVRRTFHPRFTPQLRELAGVTVTGPDRLVIALRRPSPGFLDQPLADLPILPRHIWSRLPAGGAPRGLPVGSGPYRLVRHRRGRDYRFMAVDDYFRGRPGVRRIDVEIRPDGRDVTRAFERGDVDLVRQAAVIGPSGLLEARGSGLARGSGYLGTVLAFNLRRPPFTACRAAASRRERARPAAHRARGRRVGERGRAGGARHAASEVALGDASGPAHARPRRRTRRRSTRGARCACSPRATIPSALRSRAPGRARAAPGRGARARSSCARHDAFADAIGADGARPDFELAVSVTAPLASYDPDWLRADVRRGWAVQPHGLPQRRVRATRRSRRRRPASRDARRAAVAAELRLLARDAAGRAAVLRVADLPLPARGMDGWSVHRRCGRPRQAVVPARAPPRARGAGGRAGGRARRGADRRPGIPLARTARARAARSWS